MINLQLNDKKTINKAVNILLEGGLIIFPSDTVYGALVDATNENAVKKLIEFKTRPPGKPISVFVSGFEMIRKLVNINNKQLKILNEILPGPFTVVLRSKGKVCRLLESEKKSLGIRYPIFRNIEDLVKRFGKPVTATSANLSGDAPHYSIETMFKQLPSSKKKLIDLVVDAGKLPRNKLSTVVDLTQSKIKILRQGEIGFKNVNNYISKSPNQTKKISQYLIKKHLKSLWCSVPRGNTEWFPLTVHT